jgi:type VI secretion system protein ImpI
MAPTELTADHCRALGVLTRTLLDRLLDLLHLRAQQKQQLRVRQTLFQRSENNPLKFSATSSDALESLLFRRHPSFLGPEEAVSRAFSDVVSHERALLTGVEGVIRDLLSPPPEAGGGRFLGARKSLAALQGQRQQHQQEYGDIDRMLRSDIFVDAYEAAVSRSERE